MAKFTFQKAEKSAAKLRLALFGPSGAGKTYTALRIATGMFDKIAVIDTERGSASKYADRFEFDSLELPQKDIATYCQAIRDAGEAGYQVLIIDSLSHAWKELLDEVDKLAKTKFRGNTWSAWSEGTPKQQLLVDTLLDFNGHIIATMRSKTEWTTELTKDGKNQPVRVGLAPEQGKGIEYEFDMLMELSVDHIANVIKDRTGKYQDKLIDKPSEDFGKELIAWLNSGKAVKKEEKKSLVDQAKAEGGKISMSLDTAKQVTASDGTRYGELDRAALNKILVALNKELSKPTMPDKVEENQMKLQAVEMLLANGSK